MESQGVMFFSLVILTLAGIGLLTVLYLAWRVIRVVRGLLTPSLPALPKE